MSAKIGRPRKPRGEGKTEVYPVRWRPKERLLLDLAAGESGKLVSDIVHDGGLRYARKLLGEPEES